MRILRRLTAVLALYALVIQSFLGGIAAFPSASASGLPFDVHCLDRSDGADRTDPGVPHAPAHQHSCCCTAAHPPAGMPPLATTASIAWRPRLAVRLVWRMASAAPARAPPRTLASARAPPVV
ncbi:hypothetical protein GGR33_004385 [Methylobacterium brachythecii]|uniref:DUF2946 domain-containing protein n=1 Tax=Methylobacterium brachythecii TaxID=1176177 RepID=A0A7W6AP38_9HYPH|nr:hypothetical protein [Methylobacterium brachythecii]MBB3904859.1 hypothetical protein [Methylobacterium brachythecii]